MIRRLRTTDHDDVLRIINLAAQVYHGVIPEDRWHEPYMPADEFQQEIGADVVFWVYEGEGHLLGVMGLQDKGPVALLRHAYVHPAAQRQGIGSRLLNHLLARTQQPVLIGTWADAEWAIRFYEKHSFRRVSPEEKERLLRLYWSIPERQVETSVVLADARWHPR